MRVFPAVRSMMLALAALAAIPAWPQKAEPSQAEADAMMRKLEASGALDAAVERAIERYAKRQQAKAAMEKGPATHVPSADPKRDHVRGPADAEATLIEYTDFECPFCRRFHSVPPKLLERYGGRLNWVIRNFPLGFHDPAAHREAFAAECMAKLAGNDAYWKYAELLFANTGGSGRGLPPEHSMDKLAAEFGIQAPALEACMNDPATRTRVDEDIQSGTAAGINGTPTSIVRNNKTGATMTITGAQPIEEVARSIDAVLETSER